MSTHSPHDNERNLGALVTRLNEAARKLRALRGQVENSGPWPLSPVFGAEPEARWGPPEVLAHVQEMLRYWLGELECILEHATPDGAPVPFGRLETDALRIAAIERDRQLPALELFSRTSAEVTRIAARLAELSSEDAARRGMHPRYGETDVAAIIDRHIVDHLERHTRQLQEILASQNGPT